MPDTGSDAAATMPETGPGQGAGKLPRIDQVRMSISDPSSFFRFFVGAFCSFLLLM